MRTLNTCKLAFTGAVNLAVLSILAASVTHAADPYAIGREFAGQDHVVEPQAAKAPEPLSAGKPADFALYRPMLACEFLDSVQRIRCVVNRSDGNSLQSTVTSPTPMK